MKSEEEKTAEVSTVWVAEVSDYMSESQGNKLDTAAPSDLALFEYSFLPL